jgi:phosphoserine phosphatase RsbU/P
MDSTGDLRGSEDMVVFLVDDQPIVGRAIESMLSGIPNLQFHFCSNPFEAIEMATKVRPSVILQDLVMPDVDGLTLVKFFRAHSATKQIPLIVLSSTEEAKTKAEAFAVGANDYLVKLPDKLELIARIRYHSQAYRTLVERNEMFEKLAISERRMAHELATGANYVASLLPPPIQTPFAIDWRFLPSAELGGDSLGYFSLDDNRMVMFLLDVTGHGLASALLGVTVSNVIRAKALPDVDFGNPAQVLAALNRSFKMDDHEGRTFTMWYGVFEQDTRKLTWSGGAHPSALLYRNDQTAPVELESQNAGIGMFDWDDFEQEEMIVPPDSRLYVFSDGAFEIQKQDESTWTWREFVQFMSQPEDPDQTMNDRLISHVRMLNGGGVLDDDFSIMEMRI